MAKKNNEPMTEEQENKVVIMPFKPIPRFSGCPKC